MVLVIKAWFLLCNIAYIMT